MADVAAQAVLVLQANAPPGRWPPSWRPAPTSSIVVHQASGMVAVQLDVSVGQALIRLRAHAFGNDRPLADVAARCRGQDGCASTPDSGEDDPTP